MISLLRKSGSILSALSMLGLLIATTPIINGCSRGQEAPPTPATQPNAEAPPPAAPASAPPAAQAPPAAPASGEAAAPASAPGAAAPPVAGTAPPAPGGGAAPSAPALATAAQLQQLVTPIALYPDTLVAQILAASTYPTQVVEADRFVQQNPNLTGDALAAQVNPQPWDPSIKSLCQFPTVLGMMNHNLSWTTSLGQAYYTQPQDVLGAIQVMRRRAMQAGTLKSTPQQTVVMQAAPPSAPVVQESGGQPQVVVIQPAQPNVVYVPTYNPSTVYGSAMPLPTGYSAGYSGTEMLVAGVVGFGAGMLMSSLINNGNNYWGTNWGGGNVVYNRNVYVSNSNYFIGRYPGYRPGYPGYPAPGYPGYPGNRPGYPGYPGNRPGYPGYPANVPGYPGNRPGYPPRPVPYAGNRPNLAATNPSLKPIAKPATVPNRPVMANNPNRGTKPGAPLPASNLGTNKTGGNPGTRKPGAPGRPATSLAATESRKPITKPANNMMRNPGGGGGNRRGPYGSAGASKPHGSSLAGNRLNKGNPAGNRRNLGAAGGAKGNRPTGRRPGRPSGGG